MKRNVVLDCDPGHDDAIAILLLCYSDEFNLLGVTSCAGNQTIEKTSKNIKFASHAGFCYGVKRAVETTKKLSCLQQTKEVSFLVPGTGVEPVLPP